MIRELEKWLKSRGTLVNFEELKYKLCPNFKKFQNTFQIKSTVTTTANHSKGKHHKLAMSFLSTLIGREDDESFKERSRAKPMEGRVSFKTQLIFSSLKPYSVSHSCQMNAVFDHVNFQFENPAEYSSKISTVANRIVMTVPWGFWTVRDLGANITRTLKVSTCKTNMAARYDRTIVLWKGVLKTV